ncbi:IS110 family transposase [Falsiroseomonas sp. E2-1-a20]|uniref:IS110 family transposase n=1 Tax=Falsiroseomonas sp. E2-1-a20 TaxID=3239300 RepID=UPI003F31491B
MAEDISFIGLDVHKATIAVAVADEGRHGEVRFLGEVQNDSAALDRLVAKLVKGGRSLRFCYEAGPCGYGVHRQLSARGHDCIVVAPSQIPRKPGDRVKTDRRDAVMLASLHRAGQLTPVWVPDTSHEAMRDLVRARAAAVASGKAARQQLLGFLLRHGRRFEGRPWSRTHRAWLAGQRFGHPAGQIVLQDHIDTVDAAAERVARLTRQIEAQVAEWSLAPLVIALQAMRGVALIVAVILVAELGDLSRFASPAQLMAYVGLVPSERSSGPKTRRGGITKTSNGEVRKTLVEAAWTYRRPARISELKQRSVDAAQKAAREIAWKAQVRLCARYRRLAAGKPVQVVVTAIAREMLGFIWAIGREVHPIPA